MASTVNVVNNLRKTSKGQLKYDSDWYKLDKLEDALEEFSSPPRIPYCPAAATCQRTSFIEDPEEQDEESENLSELEDTTLPSIKEDSTNGRFTSENLNKNTEEETVGLSELFRSQKAILDYENLYGNKVRSSLLDRSERFRRHSEKLAVEAQNKVYQFYSRQEHDAVNKLQQTEAQYRQKLDEINEKHKKLREHHKRHAQMLDDKMRTAEAQKRQLEKEEERLRQEEISFHLKNLLGSVMAIKDLSTKIDDIVKGCKYPDLLGDNGTKCAGVGKQILAKAEQIYKQAAVNNVIDLQCEQVLADLLKSARTTSEYAKTVVDNVNKKGEEVDKATKAAADAKAATAQPATQISTPGAADAASKVATPTGSNSNRILRGDTGISYVTVDGLKLYTRLQDLLTEHQKTYASLVDDPQFKKYRFDLQKAVNIPVNAISPTSGSHLQDKLTKLGSLLSGHAVDVDGKRISATQHPGGLAFCKDLFAKKIVSQGVEQVSSNHKSAFAFAAVAVGVWSELPEVGELILAHFYKQSPYLVPFYKPLPKNLTEGDQSKMDSTKDKFLKRMTGLVRLYASFMVASLPRGVQRPHPHGIEHAWIWLTAIMNLDPQPDITATIVYDFLQVTGHALWKAYDKQFLKLLQLFCTDYVQKIKSVAHQAGGGPVVRLENYIQKCISSGHIAPPEGLLPPGFW